MRKQGGGTCRPDSGEGAHRRLGARGGGGKGDLGLPLGGLVWGRGGRTWAVHGKVGVAAAAHGSDGRPVALGGGEWARQL